MKIYIIEDRGIIETRIFFVDPGKFTKEEVLTIIKICNRKKLYENCRIIAEVDNFNCLVEDQKFVPLKDLLTGYLSREERTERDEMLKNFYDDEDYFAATQLVREETALLNKLFNSK